MAKLVLVTLGLVVLFHLGASGQVDTLQLQELRSIQCPENIFAIFNEDINNDGIDELIVTGIYHIYVYNAFSGDLYWTSPSISDAFEAQIEFHDVNNDTIPEIAYLAPGSYLNIFDAMHDRLIWSSPHSASSYGIADRNSDGNQDIFLTGKIPDSQFSFDSAYIDVFDGPNFQFVIRDTFEFDWYIEHAGVSEYPGRIVLADLSGNQGIERKLIAYVNMRMYRTGFDGENYHEEYRYGGIAKIIDPFTFENEIGTDSMDMLIGDPLVINNNGQSYLYSYTYGHYEYCLNGILRFGSANYQIKCLSASGLVSSIPVWSYNEVGPLPKWSGAIIGDFDTSNEGYELCYGVQDSLKMFSYPDMTPLRSIRADSIAYSAINQYHSAQLFNGPQILCKRPLVAFDGTTGTLSAIFPYDTIQPAMIYDLNNDGEDELIAFSVNTIHIYHAEIAPVGIGDNSRSLPLSFHLSSAYPNPFNAQTTIKYSLPKSADVSIEIYDILGRKVETLVSERQSAGEHSIIWNAKEATSGVYFYRIKAGEYSDIKRCVLLK